MGFSDYFVQSVQTTETDSNQTVTQESNSEDAKAKSDQEILESIDKKYFQAKTSEDNPEESLEMQELRVSLLKLLHCDVGEQECKGNLFYL